MIIYILLSWYTPARYSDKVIARNHSKNNLWNDVNLLGFTNEHFKLVIFERRDVFPKGSNSHHTGIFIFVAVREAYASQGIMNSQSWTTLEPVKGIPYNRDVRRVSGCQYYGYGRCKKYMSDRKIPESRYTDKNTIPFPFKLNGI